MIKSYQIKSHQSPVNQSKLIEMNMSSKYQNHFQDAKEFDYFDQIKSDQIKSNQIWSNKIECMEPTILQVKIQLFPFPYISRSLESKDSRSDLYFIQSLVYQKELDSHSINTNLELSSNRFTTRNGNKPNLSSLSKKPANGSALNRTKSNQIESKQKMMVVAPKIQ